MKRRTTIFFITGLLALAGLARADTDESFSTGKDWLKHMSPREKYISLVPPTLLFSDYEVHLQHSLPQYIQWMDNILVRNPQLGREDVNNIFASAIFLFEPENREALKTM